MPNVALIPALAKTLVALAWADGELHFEEEATLKEVSGLLPTMSAREWAGIDMYLALPITAEERADLVQNTCFHIRSAADKMLALDAVNNMMHADGVIRPGEEEIAQAVYTTIAAVDVSPLGVLGRLIGGTLRRRPSREDTFELWRANPVMWLLRMEGQADGAADGDELAALAACIMAQVVRVTSASAQTERPVLVQALVTDWGVSSLQAERIVDAALAVTRRSVDYYHISRELVRRTTEAQRVKLLDTLFAIANAADNVSPDEIDEIRVIAERLTLTRQQFIAAKLKIAPADRGRL